MVKTPMPPQAITFPGKQSGEVFQFYYRQHWMRLRRPLQLLIVGTLIYGVLLWLAAGTVDDDTRRMLLVSVSTAFILLHFVLLTRFYTYFLYVIIVTDQKVHRIKKTLLVIDDRQSIDFWSLSEITRQQHGLIQNMFGFGTVVLHGNEELRIHFTPRIGQQIERLSALRAKARAKMMLPGMQQQQQGITIA